MPMPTPDGGETPVPVPDAAPPRFQSADGSVVTVLPDATMDPDRAAAHVAGSWATVQYDNTNGADMPVLAEGFYWFHRSRHDVPPDRVDALLGQGGFAFVRDVASPATAGG